MSVTRPRTALVTGGTGGLGSAIVARLVADGMRVVVADLSVTNGDGGAGNGDGDAAGSGSVFPVAIDVTDPASVDAALALVRERWGPVEVLVNNAGIAGAAAEVTAYPVDVWRQVIDINLTGAFICMRACLPEMIAAGYGRIVSIASIAGTDGNPFMAAYSASKAGVIALTKSAGKETATTGVLINCVVPAVFEAGLTESVSQADRELFLSRIPMRRMGRPEELAELVSWLASERCSFSTGAAFDITGGRAVY